MRYEDNRLYCPRCPVQPEEFYQCMEWQVNRVAPDGSAIGMQDGGEVLEYVCPECSDEGAWSWGLDLRTK